MVFSNLVGAIGIIVAISTIASVGNILKSFGKRSEVMTKEVTTIQLSKDTYAKLSSFRRRISAKLDRDLTFDQLIEIMIKNTESKALLP